MAEVQQTLVNDGKTELNPERTYGDRNQASLNACFPRSPIYDGSINDVDLRKCYNQMLQGPAVNGVLSAGKLKYGAGQGLGIVKLNPDFAENGAPAIDLLRKGKTTDGKEFGKGEGAPTTQYIPPLVSSPDMDAASQPAYTAKDETLPQAGGEYGSGYGSTASPAVTSKRIDNQKPVVKLGSLIMGRSFKNSDKLV